MTKNGNVTVIEAARWMKWSHILVRSLIPAENAISIFAKSASIGQKKIDKEKKKRTGMIVISITINLLTLFF